MLFDGRIKKIIIITDHFSGPGIAIGLAYVSACVCVCLDNNFWTKRPSTWIFGMLVHFHLGQIWRSVSEVKVQGHRRKLLLKT